MSGEPNLMLSRRYFLFASLSALAALAQPNGSLARKQKIKSARVALPHILAVQPWSPTITADFIALLGNGLCCVANEFGKLIIVDLFKPGQAKNTATVISELNCAGIKVIDFALWQKRAIVLGLDSSEGTAPSVTLKIISLNRLSAPSVIASFKLKSFSEATCLTVDQNIVCVIGRSLHGDNLLSTCDLGRIKASSPTSLTTLILPGTINAPIKCVTQQDRRLITLSDSDRTRENDQLTVIDITNAQDGVADLVTSTAIKGDYTAMSCLNNTVVLLGPGPEQNCQAALVSMHPTPQIVSSLELEDTQSITAVNRYKENFLVLCASLNGRRLVPLRVDKNFKLHQEKTLTLDKSGNVGDNSGRLALNNNYAVVAAGTAGVEVFSQNKQGWGLTANYSLPQMPASAMATWTDFVITAGTDLRLYDISQANKPILVKTVPLPNAVKAIASAGSFVLSLDKDTFALRKMAKPEEIIASVPSTSKHMCFDAPQQNAYLVLLDKNTTIVNQYKIYSDTIAAKNSFVLPTTLSRVFADDQYLLAAGLNDLSLYQLADEAKLLGSQHFEDVAIRDFTMNKEYIFATVIDRDCRAFLKILAKTNALEQIGSIALPHDGIGVAVSGTTIATIGSTGATRDLITVINVQHPASPTLLLSLPTLESSSSVALTDKLAIVAGRGLAIFAL